MEIFKSLWIKAHIQANKPIKYSLSRYPEHEALLPPPLNGKPVHRKGTPQASLTISRTQHSDPSMFQIQTSRPGV